MRKMNKGDKVFSIIQIANHLALLGLWIIDLNIIDPTQFDEDSKYFDPKSKPEPPRWDCVKVKYLSKIELQQFLYKSLDMTEIKLLANEK